MTGMTQRTGSGVMYSEDQLLPISALQHLLFCERQCALIHIEQTWDENRLTAEGRIMHENVHNGDDELRMLVEDTAARLHQLIRTGVTPPAIYEKKCEKCSLVNQCLPDKTGRAKSARQYLQSAICDL